MEEWIRWIPPINNRFKLNFDGSRVQNISALGWVIRDSNGIIKMAACNHIGNSSIIVVECMALRDGMLAAKKKCFLNLDIEGDSKIVIDCYNKNINIPSSILLLMEDIWNLSQGLNIFVCHVYREANRTADSNRTADCLAKKGLSRLDSSVWWSNFPKDITNISFHDYCGSLSNRACKLSVP